ncbi:hypothetical protein [Nonomuraea endophytica]|uniref:hypothetical protein n=1 Tax=Nonomuraea endophytica TaxID=714136 RepID=UPI0037CB9682
MPENVVLIIRFHPMGGEDFSVVSEDFDAEAGALEAIAGAMDERRSLVLTRARYEREAGVNSVIVNLANVVSVRVTRTDSAEAGQYL